MRITQIRIHNVLGIAELEFDAGTFNTVSGKNGEGKTSVLEAIKAAAQCGHDATLLRKGAESGEIVLVLDDGSEIQRKIGADSSQTNLVRDGKKTPRAVDAVKALTDALSVNPIDFLRATAKDRAQVLLESMPITVDLARLKKISGIPVKAQPGIHGLQVIELIRKQVYDDRTGTNRAVKEKDGTINQLRLALPPAVEGIEGDETKLQGEIDKAQDAYDAEIERVRVKLNDIELAHQVAEKLLAVNAQKRVDDIRAKAQKEMDDIVAERNKQAAAASEKITATRDAASRQRDLAKTTLTEKTQPIRAAIAVIANNREAAAARTTTLATIDVMTKELQTLEDDALKQTKALTDIAAYKLEILNSLPIPGVTVENGEIMRDGVPFDRLNTAQQVQIAVEIAKLRAGDLGVVCVDGIELLDTKTFEAFRDGALDSGLQMFVSRVSDAPFSIEVTDQ